MELPGSRIPWLRAVGAAGAVAALVVGGAVTTAGAIDDPAGAEPAKVQVMATDAEGRWFSCDIDVALEVGPAGESASLAIASTAAEGGVDGEVFDVTAAAGSDLEAPTGEAVPVPDGAFGVVGATVTAGGAGEAGLAAELPDGAEPGLSGEAVPMLPAPSDVRQGTPEECGGMEVWVASPTALPLVAVPAGAEAGGQSQDG